jgi:hypothetical protein
MYKGISNYALGLTLRRTPAAIKKKMQELGLKRSDIELKAIRSLITKRPNSGQFKKGRLPHNTKYNGYERITKDGYIEIRLSKGNFKLKHRYQWELVNGPIPKGYCLRCKDGNRLNTSPDNWYLISLGENALRTTLGDMPKELIDSMLLHKRLTKKLKQIENG